MKKKKLATRRFFVSREALLRGERIEKKEDEMTPEEMEKFKKDFTDNFMKSLGFVKKSDLNDDKTILLILGYDE
jgi:hypothetical protein